MKKFTTALLFLITGTFMAAPAASAKGNYKSELSIILSEICGSSECKGDVVNGQLILFGKDGLKHVAPDGTYTDEGGKSIRVIDGRILQKSAQPMRRDH